MFGCTATAETHEGFFILCCTHIQPPHSVPLAFISHNPSHTTTDSFAAQAAEFSLSISAKSLPDHADDPLIMDHPLLSMAIRHAGA